MEQPLVSVIVISYNSAKYIIDTLESIKDQTYSNIELILTDDASDDETVILYQEWIRRNKKFFRNNILLTVPINEGIPKNCNRGILHSNGQWIKIIAADDILDSKCIANFVDFILYNKKANFCYSDFYTFKTVHTQYDKIEPRKHLFMFGKLNSKSQAKVLKFYSPVPAPTFFFNRKTFNGIGNFDETFPFMEDWPTFYNIAFSGFKIYYLPEKTVYYRLNPNSLTKKSTGLISTFHKKIISVIEKKFIKKYGLYDKIIFMFYKKYIDKYENYTPNTLIAKFFQRVFYIPILLLEKRRNQILVTEFKKTDCDFPIKKNTMEGSRI